MTVADPYRWLENMNSAETKAWVEAENSRTESHLSRIPGRQALGARIADFSRIAWYSSPRREAHRYFWVQSDGRQQQPVLWSALGLDAAPTVLFDPNAVSRDGSLGFAGWTGSAQGTRIAYGLSIGGGDWQRWRLRDVASREDLDEPLEHIKYYPPVFSRDGDGVYYSRFPAPAAGKDLTEADHDCRVYFHRLGTPVSSDIVVYERPDHPTWQFDLAVSSDRRFLVITIGDGEVGDRGEEQVAVLDLIQRGAQVVPLIKTFGTEFLFAGSDGPVLFFKTNLDAPRKKVIAIDVRRPARSGWKTVIAEGPDAIDDVHVVARRIFVTRLHDVHHVVGVYDTSGRLRGEVQLPGLGTVYGFAGRPDATETFFRFYSFTNPGTVYRYDFATGRSQVWKAPQLPFSPADYETRQIFFTAGDGTRVPMFVSSRKGRPLEGRRPTVMTAYGFGGIPYPPRFDPSMIAWMERGGVSVVVNIRGGGEYGEAWHRAAMRTHRQVGWDDFIAAGEWLVANGVTTRERLGILGVSGGGTLVGGVLVQRPDLFGAAVPIAGVLDLLRFQLFGEGAGWQGDMGSPDDEVDFHNLYKLSPLHNVRDGMRYPATLIITSDHDVRVAPLHSYKFAAALQHAQAGPAPILLQVQTQTGHGFGSTLDQRTQQRTDIVAFLAVSLGLPIEAPAASR